MGTILTLAFFVILTSLGFAVLFAVLCARIAKSRGRDPIPWVILGFFFNVLALAVLLIVTERKELSVG